MSHSEITSLEITEKKIFEIIGNFEKSPAVEYAESLIVSGIHERGQMLVWGRTIEDVTKEIRRIDKLRAKRLAPILAAKKNIESLRKQQSSWFDKPIAFLQDIKDRLSRPYGEFVLKCKRDDELAAIAEQEEEARKAAEASKSENNEFMADIIQDEVLSNPLPKPIATIRTGTGSTTIKTRDCVRLVDIAKVPSQYVVIDEKKLLDHYKIGMITEVPGVEFYQEPYTYVR